MRLETLTKKKKKTSQESGASGSLCGKSIMLLRCGVSGLREMWAEIAKVDSRLESTFDLG